MADNATSEAVVSSGVIFQTASFTFSGDTVHCPGSFSQILTGSEGAWTSTLIVGGAGAVTGGVQRMTLASDDPAVVALQIMDDWDETNRCAVNVISGQAGIAAGAGAVGATVPRVTLASDDPAVTALQLLDNAISGAGFNITQLSGASVPIGAGLEATAVRVTLPTDGTGKVNAAQSGTWNVTNVSGTVSLPTGASTLAEQQSQTTHLGTLAGTDFMLGTDFSAVLGSASLIIATQADNTANTQDTLATSALGYVFDGTTWDRMRGDATDGLLVNLGTNNDITVTSGNIIVDSITGTVTVGTHAVTQSGTWNVGTVTTVTTCSTVTNLAQMGGAAISMGTGVRDAGTQRVTIATNDAVPVTFTGSTDVATQTTLASALTALQTLDNIVSGNEAQCDIVAELPAGTNLLGRVNVEPQTGNGLSIFRSIDLDESEEEVKATAGAIYGGMVTNTATSTRFIKFYNATAANVTVGSTTPVITWGIPGNSSDDIGALFNTGGMGIAFDTAITVAATTGVADADTGAPGANEVIINLFYK